MPDPTFDLVIFDNDGVLIDSEKLAARGNAELLTGLGYPMTAEDCERRFAGLSDRDMVAELRAEGVPLPDDFIEQMYAISEHAFLTELEPIAGEPTKRAFAAFLDAFNKGILIRTTGDIIALSPPLIIEKTEIDFLFDTLRGILKTLD